MRLRVPVDLCGTCRRAGALNVWSVDGGVAALEGGEFDEVAVGVEGSVECGGEFPRWGPLAGFGEVDGCLAEAGALGECVEAESGDGAEGVEGLSECSGCGMVGGVVVRSEGFGKVAGGGSRVGWRARGCRLVYVCCGLLWLYCGLLVRYFVAGPE
jgi:hypothetical protein